VRDVLVLLRRKLLLVAAPAHLYQEEHLPRGGAHLLDDGGDAGQFVDVGAHDSRVHLHLEAKGTELVKGRDGLPEVPVGTSDPS